ncbi:flavodoxin family protein [bacterium]|nr:flavodoxin family protein [bacterium]
MKALFINGSPRKKNGNTITLLENAAHGAQEAGAETEIINLYDYDYKGCVSCFACKIKNSKTNGLCAYKDELRPILGKALYSDVVIIGSPIYFSYPTAQCRAFLERFLFAAYTYLKDPEHPGTTKRVLDRIIHTAMIYTMNVSEDHLEHFDYHKILNWNEMSLRAIFGYSESLYSCDTYQFSDYDRYDCDVFDKAHKLDHREKQFPLDCQKAYELGKRLVEMTILNK